MTRVVNLPTNIQAAYGNVYAPTITDSLGTGGVIQGQAAGTYSDNIVALQTAGAVVIRRVSTYTIGDSTTAIRAGSGKAVNNTDSRLISGCTVTYPRPD